MTTGPDRLLLEREKEVERLRATVGAARDGRGRAVLVEGATSGDAVASFDNPFMDGEVRALAASGSTVYAGGTFTEINVKAKKHRGYAQLRVP